MMYGAVFESETPLRQRIEAALKSIRAPATVSKSSDARKFFGARRQDNGTLALAAWIAITISILGTFLLAALLFGIARPDVLQFAHSNRLLVVALIFGAQFIHVSTVAAYCIRSGKREDLLAESESQVTSNIEAAEVGMWHWNSATNLLELSERARTILSLTPAAEYDPVKIMALVNPDDLTAIRKTILTECKFGNPFDVTFRLIPKDGKPARSLRCRGSSQTGENGGTMHFDGTLVDVSDRVAMQAEIEMQRQSLIHLARVGTVGNLSGALAHELSQPLTAIMNNAHAIERMLDQKPVNLPEVRNAISDIIEDDSRVRDVIRHLRSLLKKDSSSFGRVDMTLLIHKVLGLVRRELALHRIKLAVEIAPDVPPVWGDDVQLQQLLLNLVTNAIDAIAASEMPGGSLAITAYGTGKASNNFFHLCIADTGSGLPFEAVERVFDPFYSTKDQGMGLGLTICQAIVSGHTGTIVAENNKERGASFHVTLPTASEKHA